MNGNQGERKEGKMGKGWGKVIQGAKETLITL